MLVCIWHWWKNKLFLATRYRQPWLMKVGACPERVVNFSHAPCWDRLAGMKLSVRSPRRSHVFRIRACGFPMLIATNISTCSRLYSKLLGALPAKWTTLGFAILPAPGGNRRIRECDGGYSRLV